MEDSKILSELISQIQSIHKFDVRLRNQVEFEDYINISVPHCYQALLSWVEKFQSGKVLTVANLVEIKKGLAPKINVLRNELTIINRDHAKLYAPDLSEINDELSSASYDLQTAIDHIENQEMSFIESTLDLTGILYEIDKSIAKVSAILEDEDKSAFGRALTDEDFRLINLICAMHRSIDASIISYVGMQEYLSKDFGYFDDLSNFKDDQSKVIDLSSKQENEDTDDHQLLQIIGHLLNKPTLQSDVLNFLKKFENTCKKN